MESLKPTSAPTKSSKLSKTFHKVIHLKRATKSAKSVSNTSFCLLIPQDLKLKPDSHCFHKTTANGKDEEEAKLQKNRAAMEALLAKLFATVSSVKAAYAELQLAQFPYNSDAVQAADEAVVLELKSLSEMKHRFLRKQLDTSPPHVTLLLAEMQEQQSLMKMYEITMKKMQAELKSKDNDMIGLNEKLDEIVSNNKSLEKTLKSSGQFSILDCIKLSGTSNPSDFGIVLNYTIRSVRSFVKMMIREMEASNWDIEAASKSIQPGVIFPEANHRCFAFESFVCREMFDGFDDYNFMIQKETIPQSSVFVERFKKLKSVNPVQFLKKSPNSEFGKFTRAKYLRLVHPKMETSFSGNLNQRKMINSGEFPETAFFAAFAEMAKRVWLLHCLAFSFDEEVSVFQVVKSCRFSEVYMESVRDDAFAAAENGVDGGFQVAFTVVPGFKIGKTVLQSQVYLFPANF